MYNNKIKQLNNLLTSLLGNGTRPNQKFEVVFHCPFCNHYKKKLAINLLTHKWHCWVCNTKGGNLYQLFKKVNADNHYYEKLKEIAPEKKKTIINTQNEKISLPNEFQSLLIQSKQPEYKRAIKYLRNRNVTIDDIVKFNIGYCETGPYSERIIIPSYNCDNVINYFISRTINGSLLKYKNPKISKNIIGFENMIDWDSPIILVEGVFDSIAIKHNSIPLFGKFLSSKLKEKILSTRPEDIYICLDSDAIYDSINIAKFLLDNGIKNVYIIELPVGEDPGTLGYKKTWELINKSQAIDQFTLMAMSL